MSRDLVNFCIVNQLLDSVFIYTNVAYFIDTQELKSHSTSVEHQIKKKKKRSKGMMRIVYSPTVSCIKMITIIDFFSYRIRIRFRF